LPDRAHIFSIFLDSVLPADYTFFFSFKDTATTEIYTLSLHDALPISEIRAPPGLRTPMEWMRGSPPAVSRTISRAGTTSSKRVRSEEHTSELQSLTNLVCRLLLEKKKKTTKI